MTLPQETIDRLKNLATDSACSDNEYFNPYNYDDFCDAYNGGCRDGRIELAREILDKLKIEYWSTVGN